MTNKTLFTIVAAVTLVVAGGAIAYNKIYGDTLTVGVYDTFAQCISASGAKFYGAFWCSHCQNQKKMFGTASQYLPYVECSTPDGQGQQPVCADAKISGYPTWVFASGETRPGEVQMADLAELSKCTLPTPVN